VVIFLAPTAGTSSYHRHAVPGGSGYKTRNLSGSHGINADGTIIPMDPLTTLFQPGDVGEPIANGKGLAKFLSTHETERPSLLIFLFYPYWVFSAQAATITSILSKPKRLARTSSASFFEDISYAADGGLYGELIQNRSFEYAAPSISRGIRLASGRSARTATLRGSLPSIWVRPCTRITRIGVV